MPRTIRQTFDELKRNHRLGVVPFIPAGYPDLATTAAALIAADQAGAAVIELGFPFSDPIADGPTIQEAFTAALGKKLKVADILATVKSTAPSLRSPLVAMVSYSIVFRYGLSRFLAEAKGAGFQGLILPDLPPPEAQKICTQISSAGLDTILLISPTTPAERRQEIVKLCTGFVYYLSVSGITGERDKLPGDLLQSVRQIKTLTDLPVCVGFGIHRPAQIQELAQFADGAIVGSAIVRRMKDHLSQPAGSIGKAVGEYVLELSSAAL